MGAPTTRTLTTSLRTPPRGRARRGSAQSLAGLYARSAGSPPEPGLSGGRMASRPLPRSRRLTPSPN